jgi:hypothetical protein
MNDIDSLLHAARCRPNPWDAARQDRVLTKVLGTRATRARRKATRVTVAGVCGAILVLAFGLRAVALSSPSGANGSIESGARASRSAGVANAEPPQTTSIEEIEEIAALEHNDGGYGRD